MLPIQRAYRLFKHVSCFIPLIMANNVNATSAQASCKRLLNVEGREGRQNDVIICGVEKLFTSKQHVIFFGGDVQV